MSSDLLKVSPFFSVIVPAFNAEEFIKKCIDSVLQQTYTNFELILIDDGSRDHTLEICQTYGESDTRVKVLHQENGGHTSARNAGLRASKGAYIVFLDSDDWLDCNVLEMCIEPIVRQETDIVIFGIRDVSANTKFSIELPDGDYYISQKDKKIIGRILMGEDGRFLFPKSLSGKCFKRETVWRNQLSVPEKVVIGEDGAAFIGTMLDASVISVVSGAFYNCIIRQNSVSRSSDTKALSRLPALFEYYWESFARKGEIDYKQMNRFIVAQLYTALLLSLRGSCSLQYVDDAFESIVTVDYVSAALKNARFSLKGYKMEIKKLILQHRLWWLAKFLDK